MIWTDHRPDSGRRRSRLARSFRAQLLKASCVGLLVFHAILLIQRIGDSSIFTAAVLARWLGAAALMAAVVAFQRLAPAQLRGARPMVVFWLLVVLLHAGPPVASAGDAQLGLASVVELALVLPAIVAAVGAQRRVAATLVVSALRAPLPVPLHDFRIRRFVSSRAPPLG